MTPRFPLLSIQNLSVAFGTAARQLTVVRDVSLDVFPGQTVAVVGESGSGKSTTAAAVNRLLPANGRITAGDIFFDGRNLADATEREMMAIRGARIGFVPQDPMSNLNPLMRIGDQIAEALEVHGRSLGKGGRGQVIELLDMVGIPEPERRLSQYPHEFSGGMRQRALIAMGLACRPGLLIADEPTSALDVTVQRRILDQLEELTERMDTAVLLITHDLALAAERADSIVVMRQGEIVESGAATQILNDPQHDYTQRLLLAAPSLTSRSIVTTTPPGVARGQRPSEATPESIVEVRNLNKIFTIRGPGGRGGTTFTAVDDISFTIPRGQTVSIVGESGSGKSTTANLMLGLEDITSGQILFDGTDVSSLGRRELFAFRRRVQPVFQNPYASLDPRYTIAESITEPLRVHKMGTKTSRHSKCLELLDQVALPAIMADRLPHELSGGQRQRVAIARALALSPELVVLDEAVSALDVLVQAQTLDLLAELQKELGLSYLFISHDLAVVRMISHAVHVMQRGRIVESGTPTDIFEDPQAAYTRELLAAIPAVKSGA
ncbi:ABC transporter ATP-binding protein [Arthrobacter sp. UYCu712]|uniref:ABC transporter ATP-binding protein n=1 Tax=Arthrobacter sp. UYCu712 TaxID=3156340 RepID=UPI0033935B2E